MAEEIIVTENEIYYYYDLNGKKYCTPNVEFATNRANFYKTYDIYIEKYL